MCRAGDPIASPGGEGRGRKAPTRPTTLRRSAKAPFSRCAASSSEDAPASPTLVRMESCLSTRRSSSRCSSKCASCIDWRTKPHASEQDSTHTCKHVCAGTTALRRLFRQVSVTLPIKPSTHFRDRACRRRSQDRFIKPSSAGLLADAPPVRLTETTVLASEWDGLGETRTSTARGVPRAARLARRTFCNRRVSQACRPGYWCGGGTTPAAHPRYCSYLHTSRRIHKFLQRRASYRI